MNEKIVEGWFIYVEDHEYGPTLVKWNKEGRPTHKPVTSCDCLEDPDWEEVILFSNVSENWGGWSEKGDISFEPIYAKIIVTLKTRITSDTKS